MTTQMLSIVSGQNIHSASELMLASVFSWNGKRREHTGIGLLEGAPVSVPGLGICVYTHTHTHTHFLIFLRV